MNYTAVITALRQLGHDPVGVQPLSAWDDVTVHEDIRQYLEFCVPAKGFQASGITVLGVERGIGIHDENAPGVSPGGRLRRFGYIAIGISVGGHGLMFSSEDGAVYWADYTDFSDEDEIDYQDRTTKKLHSVPFTRENIFKALVPITSSIEEFLLKLLRDEYEDLFDSLD